jgi:hypothetical protein
MFVDTDNVKRLHWNHYTWVRSLVIFPYKLVGQKATRTGIDSPRIELLLHCCCFLLRMAQHPSNTIKTIGTNNAYLEEKSVVL